MTINIAPFLRWIRRLICWKLRIFTSPLSFGAPAPCSLWNFKAKLTTREVESWGYCVVKVACQRPYSGPKFLESCTPRVHYALSQLDCPAPYLPDERDPAIQGSEVIVHAHIRGLDTYSGRINEPRTNRLRSAQWQAVSWRLWAVTHTYSIGHSLPHLGDLVNAKNVPRLLNGLIFCQFSGPHSFISKFPLNSLIINLNKSTGMSKYRHVVRDWIWQCT